ncbi:hypothetical protein H5410_040905 [Solanum commersonii]|uniref:Uncharacterized protein n=1 Tax=Solanum commersonii TaxID=4109 RepID=A0A9J5XS62_SOLCO|nr:hypothetical protein H5410_040905 [Solanum commersonii]
MDTVFSVDEIADQLWSSPPPMRLSHDLDSSSATSSSKMMNRSSSEWAFQRFLQEAAAADTTSSSSSQQIKLNHNLIPDQSKPMSSFGSEPPIDSDEHQAFLKRRLDLACAAFALNRASCVKSQDSASLPPKKGSLAANGSLSGSQLPPKGSGQELAKVQDKDAGEPIGIPPLPAVQKKPGIQVRSTTSGSSGEQSDDDEAEGEAETTQSTDPTDVKRVRRVSVAERGITRCCLKRSLVRTSQTPMGGNIEEFSAMGKSLTEQCRVKVEGPRAVNFFSRRRGNDGGGNYQAGVLGVEGLPGGAVKCLDIGKNTNDESTLQSLLG